jgi:CHAT domain-containing protein/tetratricopeptide (TPR) repeat protein
MNASEAQPFDLPPEEFERGLSFLLRVAENLDPIQNRQELWLVLSSIGNAYSKRTEGIESDNLEQAIEFLRRACTLVHNTNLLNWARSTVRLADLLVKRSVIRQRCESLEEATAECRKALAVIPREQEPDLWGECQTVLAMALCNRTIGTLDDNLDEAIAACRSALEVFPRETAPEEWASTMNILGSAFARRTRDGLAQNQEEALSAFEAALQVRTRAAAPRQWAHLQNNLAVLYRERIEGNPTENLKRAVAAGMGALEVLDPEENFVEWVTTVNDLASAYRFRITDDARENLKTAISLYESIAERLDVEETPELCADTWHNLAAAYGDQTRGDYAENLEKAIVAGERSLAARSIETAPLAWARTALVVAATYSERTERDRTENVEKAIEYCHRALGILTFESSPLEWAGGMMTMAALYLQRQRVRRDVNVEAAILACEQALIVFRRDTLPLDWARTLNTLGIAYFYRPRGERIENLTHAAEIFLQALEDVDENHYSRLYASLLQSLANSYLDLEQLRGSRRPHLKKAIALYEAALEIRTKESGPYDWARLQHNLGSAWGLLARGSRSRGFREARTAYENALSVRTLEAYPDEHRITQRRLGNLHFTARRWRDAETAYASASAGLEKVYETIFTPDSRLAELAGISDVALGAAYAQARMRRPGAAIETLERSRTRTLTDALIREAATLRIVNAEDRASWSATVSRIAELEVAARAASATHPRAFLDTSAEIWKAYQDLLDLTERVRPQVPDLFPGPLDLSEIQDIAESAGRPLVYLVTTRHGSLALPVLPGNPALRSGDALRLDGFAIGDLMPLLEDKENYVHASLSGDPAQLEAALDRAWPLWHDTLMEPLSQWIAMHGFSEAILIPCGALSVLPLHAASERVLWTVAPSARVLQKVVSGLRARETSPSRFLGVGNPWPSRAPLHCGEIEIEDAGALFPPEGRCLLRRFEATRSAVTTALAGATHLHFACHGRFYIWVPLESGLELANGKALVLRDILDGGLDLAAARLAVLSACETALIEYQRTPDEVLSIPAAFLQAGVPGVISSLWGAGDLASTLLVRELYRAHLGEGLEPARALRQAQEHLRKGTAAELGVAELCEEWFERSSGRDRNAYRALRYYRAHPDAVPFRHPRHWAGFVLNGL